MQQSLVMTVIGRDRPGLVESVAALIDGHQGNWEESRMVQLAGEFAGVIRVQVPVGQAGALEEALGDLEGVTVVVARTRDEPEVTDSRLLELEVVGQDHPGIVHRLARAMARSGVNVEELETEVVDAPMSGGELFRAQARLQVPAALSVEELRQELERLAADLIVDVSLEAPDAS